MSPTRAPRSLNPEWVRQGATLKAVRELRGYKVGEFANRMGLSYAYLSNIEAGRKRMTPQIVAKAAIELQVPQITFVRPDEFDPGSVAS